MAGGYEVIARPAAIVLSFLAATLTQGIFFVSPSYADSSTTYIVAYVGSNSDLWYYDGKTGAHDTHQGVSNFGSPSAGFDSSAYEIAYQGYDSDLDLYMPSSGRTSSTGLQMQYGTNPSISTNDVIAFEGNNDDLWYWDGAGHDTHIGMFAQSPNLSISPFPEPEGTPLGLTIAFSSSNNHVSTYNIETKKLIDSGLGIEPSTRPSIGQRGDGSCCLIAFAANTDVLWYYTLGGSRVNTGEPMEPYTSPTLEPVYGSALIAFAGKNQALNVYNYLSKADVITHLGLEASASPDIGALLNSRTGQVTSYQSWFPANATFNLYRYNSTDKSSGSTGAVTEDSGDGYQSFVSYTPGIRLAARK